jgi:hypothetical protein
MKEPQIDKRDVARELARKYSTMTHDELDILEGILVPMKFAKGEMILKEGDEVLYGKYSGTELEFEGTKYLMMRQSDVLAVIEK